MNPFRFSVKFWIQGTSFGGVDRWGARIGHNEEISGQAFATSPGGALRPLATRSTRTTFHRQQAPVSILVRSDSDLTEPAYARRMLALLVDGLRYGAARESKRL